MKSTQAEHTLANTDYRGARGSNAGDQFHELWALLQMLELLKIGAALKGVTVEGVKSESGAGDDGPVWDGVDCGLYFEGASLETAKRVELVQLKYSSANPDTDWSIARIASSTSKQGNSVVRRMADAFKSARARMNKSADLSIRLVSNQGIASDLSEAVQARWTGDIAGEGLAKTVTEDLDRLRTASALDQDDFSAFISCLDFSECGKNSRFALKDKVVNAAATLLSDDVSSEVRELQQKVRELMLPERAREAVTEKDVLLWFDVSSRDGLFPCPPDIRLPPHAIAREAAEEALRYLSSGARALLVHGPGGCGKTTLMDQIRAGLPAGSVSVVFDCFGGGRYMYSDDKRHLPENAFLQLANELAVDLQLPIFIPRSLKHPANIQMFLAKLRAAGQALAVRDQSALLVVIVDAADNSVSAASTADPPDRCFVYDLAGANWGALPNNVRFVFSARTGRRTTLRLPATAREVICPPFSLEETRVYLRSTIPDASDEAVRYFHDLSRGVPRVQAYALATASEMSQVLEVLLPAGKSLGDVLKTTFEIALQKLGQPDLFEHLLAALAFLPPPANIFAIANVVNTTEETVRDLAIDLSPGLRLENDVVSISDEDYENYIRSGSERHRATTQKKIAEHFLATFLARSYSAIHIADSLVAVGRGAEVLTVIEKDPQVQAVDDPIVRRQVQIRRLKLSLASYVGTDHVTEALKTVLLSAEAERDEGTIRDVLEKEMDLSVEFGGSSLRRLIVLDPDRVGEHGSFLAQDAARSIRSGDRTTARERLHFYDAWLKRRREIEDKDLKEWKVDDRDVAARCEAILGLRDAETAFGDLMRWSPRTVPIRVASILVPQLISSGKSASLKGLLGARVISKPWDLLVRVPLAMAGEIVDPAEIEASLRRLRRRLIPDPGHFSYTEDFRWQEWLLDVFITSCELALSSGCSEATIRAAVTQLFGVVEAKKQRVYASDVRRLDGLFRLWTLQAALDQQDMKLERFIGYISSLGSAQETQKKKPRGRPKKKIQATPDRREEERLEKKIRALFPIYASRASILVTTRQGAQIASNQLSELQSLGGNAYDFDYDHDGIYLRTMAARSVMQLLIVPDISGADLARRASSLLEGRFSDLFAMRRSAIWNLLRLRNSEAAPLVELVAQAALEVKQSRAASSDKVEALVRFSRLLLPVSRDDASSLFNDAIAIAKEIDREAMDQIQFLDVCASEAAFSNQDERRAIAADVLVFVSGAAERLSDQEYFPWDAASRALVTLDVPVALAGSCRWSDEGTVGFERTLNRVLITALERKVISPEVALSLSLIIRVREENLHKQLVAAAARETRPKILPLLEELSKDVLLLTDSGYRRSRGELLIEVARLNDPLGGRWVGSLEATGAFLKAQGTVGEKPAPPRQSSTIYGVTEPPGGAPKNFAFDAQEGSYGTFAAILEVLQRAKDSGLHFSERDLLQQMQQASSRPKDRVAFLNAVTDLPEGAIWGAQRARTICETVESWKGTPGVAQWCKEVLPGVIASLFLEFARYLKEGNSALTKALELVEGPKEARRDILLAGIAQAGLGLDSRTLFGIAELLARSLDRAQPGSLVRWYASRLRNRVPLADQVEFDITDVPTDTADGVARFLFAVLSDVDTRLRWRGAHALRRLARLKEVGIVEAVVGQLGRTIDKSFRDPSAPFYFLASKLWLSIALYRISAETPTALRGLKRTIIDLTIQSDLPHVVIREYSKRTLEQLAATGAIALTAAEKRALREINVPKAGAVSSGPIRQHSFDHQRPQKEHRFKFDGLDTTRYWYDNVLRIFPTVSANEFLDMAEKWIIDKWGVEPEANWWNKEPRKARFDERRFGLYTHSHGSLPILERYGAHFEWHAMFCVAGELLKTHPVGKPEYGEKRFESWLESFLPTAPPEWISDFRGETPLEERFWREDSRTDNGWVRSARLEEFKEELGLAGQRPGWIVVNGWHDLTLPKRDAHVWVSSALVAPQTSGALMRAIDTASRPREFAIPSEESHSDIDEPPYRLLGWASEVHGDTRFDDHDPLRHDTSQMRRVPGKTAAKLLGLRQLPENRQIWVTGENIPAFAHEAWSDEPLEDERYPRGLRTGGWRLWANTSELQSLLARKGMDLICQVEIVRRLRKEYSRSYESDQKQATLEKTFLLKADGSLYGAKGRIGAWANSRRGDERQQPSRYAQSLDGASHRRVDRRRRSSG
jgi:hypothetical protein